MVLMLAWAGWLVGIVTVLFLLVCVMMILTVLIQRPQGGGLSGAFGSGAGSGQTAFGAKTGDALTIFTIIVFVLFLGLAITLNYGYRPPSAVNALPASGTQEPEKQGAPAGKGASDKGAQPAPAPVDAVPVPTNQDGGKGATPPSQPAPTEPAPSPTPAPAEQPATAPK